MKKPTHFCCFMALMLLLVTGGCATLPDNVGREASTAYVDTHDTRIGRNVQAAMVEHPGTSGYLLLGNGLDAFVVAAGFADSVGDEEYNLALSEHRATSFKDHLVNNYNIDGNRIVTLWYGELNPAADNATDEGRQRNRRVEIAVGLGGAN